MKYIDEIVAGLLVLYAVFAFVLNEFNPMMWMAEARGLLVVFSAIFAFFFFMNKMDL